MTRPSATQLDKELERSLESATSLRVTAQYLGEFELRVVGDSVQFVRRTPDSDEVTELTLLPTSCYRSRRGDDELTTAFQGTTIDGKTFSLTVSATPGMVEVPVEVVVDDGGSEWEG